MNELLTRAEIEARHRDEWILIENPEVDEALQVVTGVVWYHSKDRDEVYRKLPESKSKRVAVLYTGAIPNDEDVVLLGDDRTGARYVLVPADRYEQMRVALEEADSIREAYPLMDAVARAEGWDDPEMDSYDIYRRPQP